MAAPRAEPVVLVDSPWHLVPPCIRFEVRVMAAIASYLRPEEEEISAPEDEEDNHDGGESHAEEEREAPAEPRAPRRKAGRPSRGQRAVQPKPKATGRWGGQRRDCDSQVRILQSRWDDCIVSDAEFRRLVKQGLESIKKEVKFTDASMRCLQAAFESYASQYLLRGAIAAAHRRCLTLKPEDLRLFHTLENVEGMAVAPRNSARMQDSAPPAKRIRRNHVK